MVEVREAQASEWAAIGDLTASTYLAEGLADQDYAQTLRDVPTRAAHSTVLVALAGGALAGSATLVTRGGRYAEGHEAGTAVIRMLVTDPAFRGAGIGRALVEAAIERSRREGCSVMRLSSGVRMHAAHRLYERLGFTRTPEHDWWPLPHVKLITYVLPLEQV